MVQLEREELFKSLRFWNRLRYCVQKRTGPVLTPIGIGGINPINVNHSSMKLLQLLLCVNICQKRMLVCILVVSCLLHYHFFGSESRIWQYLVVQKNPRALSWEGEEMLEYSSVLSSCLCSSQLWGTARQLGLGAAGGLATQPHQEISAQKVGTVLDFRTPNLRYR